LRRFPAPLRRFPAPLRRFPAPLRRFPAPLRRFLLETLMLPFIRITLLLCILMVLIASNAFIIPGIIALGYAVACTATIILTYV
jgi:hypothetical protein